MIKKTTDLGNIDISTDVIATICGGAATECYGVVGMASQNILKDGIAEILKKENFAKGIEVHQLDDAKISIDLYIVVAYGVKISEVALEVQQKVRHVLETSLDISVDSVNVYVQDVKVV